MEKLKLYGLVGITLLAFFSAIWSWYHPRYESDGSIRTVYVNVTDKIRHSVAVPCPGGVVQGTSESLPSSQEGPKEPVIASGDVPASGGGFEVKAVLSPETGQASILALPKPKPFFGFEDTKEIGVRYNGLQGSLFGRWTFVRVGSFYGSLYAEGSTDRHAFAGVEVLYRF